MTSMKDKITYMQTWAAQNNAQLVTRGEVGFGRPCVGISQGQSYLDFLWCEYNEDRDVMVALYKDERIQAFRRAAPEDAYHKHPCMAVLVHAVDGGEDYGTALNQLYEWVKWCEDNGWGVVTEARKTFNEPGTFGAQLELLMSGLTVANLRPL
jgi:hypothetical protein